MLVFQKKLPFFFFQLCIVPGNIAHYFRALFILLLALVMTSCVPSSWIFMHSGVDWQLGILCSLQCWKAAINRWHKTVYKIIFFLCLKCLHSACLNRTASLHTNSVFRERSKKNNELNINLHFKISFPGCIWSKLGSSKFPVMSIHCWMSAFVFLLYLLSVSISVSLWTKNISSRI